MNHIDPSGNIFTIAIAMPNVVNLRSQQIIVSGGQVYRANEALRRLAVGSVKQLKALRKAKAGFWKDMKNNEKIHHLIERGFGNDPRNGKSYLKRLMIFPALY